jgi:hypothetical protein
MNFFSDSQPSWEIFQFCFEEPTKVLDNTVHYENLYGVPVLLLIV